MSTCEAGDPGAHVRDGDAEMVDDGEQDVDPLGPDVVLVGELQSHRHAGDEPFHRTPVGVQHACARQPHGAVAAAVRIVLVEGRARRWRAGSPRYSRRTSPVPPSMATVPCRSRIAREQSAWTAGMLWLTNRTVRPSLRHVPHLAEALLLEVGVADGEHLVDQEDLGLEVRRDRERQPQVHAARVPLDRRVDELLDLRERDDLVELALDLGAAHPQDRAVQVDVLAARQLRMESGPDLEQRSDAAVDLGEPARGLRDPRQDLQQRALTGAVAADDADDLPRPDLEAHVVERPGAGRRLRPLAVRGRAATAPSPSTRSNRATSCTARRGDRSDTPCRGPGPEPRSAPSSPRHSHQPTVVGQRFRKALAKAPCAADSRDPRPSGTDPRPSAPTSPARGGSYRGDGPSPTTSRTAPRQFVDRRSVSARHVVRPSACRRRRRRAAQMFASTGVGHVREVPALRRRLRR